MLLETGHLGGYATSNEVGDVYPAVTNGTNIINNNNNVMRNDDDDESVITIGRGTTIQNFYAGQSIFITGSTGFLGKLLVEKLLRSCPDISTIYLLIRGKKDKNVQDRVEDLFNDPIYDRLREELPKFRHKIVAVSGDCSVQGLGLSSADRERLVQEVSVVFHSAATVRFDEKMDTALAINVGSTSEMIDLCKRMERLKAFIHVSTAYANCHLSEVAETFYSHPTTYEDLGALLSGLDPSEIAKITPEILGKWPNTYTFTKALAEVVVREKSQGLRMGIFRPAIVISSAFEPIPGWIDNFYGPTGAVAAAARGILKTMYCQQSTQANIVPVDFTVNALIVSAWDVANQPDRTNENMMIYNYVSTVESPITWDEYRKINLKYAHEYPLSEVKWTISLTLQNQKLMYHVNRILLHYVPAVLVDTTSVLLGQRPMLMDAYAKIDKFLNVVTWFCMRDWIFTNDNVQRMWKRLETKDQQNFRFNIKDLNWDKYFRNYMKGVRIHLFKDDLSTLEKSRKRLERLRLIHETMKIFLYTMLFLILWKLVTAFLS